MTCDW